MLLSRKRNITKALSYYFLKKLPKSFGHTKKISNFVLFHLCYFVLLIS